MSTATAVSVEEYLATSYEFDPEYIGGELVERPMPTYGHARAQNRIGAAFETPEAGLYAAPQVRVRVTPDRYRVPDIVIYADREPSADYPTETPFGVIEVLSPGDGLSELLDKFEDFASLGVSHLWLVDPEHRRISRYEDGSLIRQATLEMRSVKLTPEAIFG